MAETNISYDKDSLVKLKKDQLIDLICNMKEKIDELTSNNKINDRITKLEKSHYKSLQYSRRDTIEIAGIPKDVNKGELEKTAINILENIGVKVTENEIQATHRLNKKGDVIMKF